MMEKNSKIHAADHKTIVGAVLNLKSNGYVNLIFITQFALRIFFSEEKYEYLKFKAAKAIGFISQNRNKTHISTTILVKKLSLNN